MFTNVKKSTVDDEHSQQKIESEKFIIRMTTAPVHPDTKKNCKEIIVPVLFFSGRKSGAFSWADAIKFAHYFLDRDDAIAEAHAIEDHANSLFASGSIGRAYGEDMNTLEVLSLHNGNLRLVPFASKIRKPHEL